MLPVARYADGAAKRVERQARRNLACRAVGRVPALMLFEVPLEDSQ
jgi:hypothetical protein